MSAPFREWDAPRLWVREDGRLRLTRAGRAKLRLLAISIALIAVVMVVSVTALKLKAKADVDAARPAAMAQWRIVKARLAARLHDQANLELGAICGLVNGRSSFGGLTGMVPFFTDGQTIRYALDTPQSQFGDGWSQCMGDTWLQLNPGSYATGICATKHPFKSCGAFGDYDTRW
jgi:hypothetical protein